MKIVYVFTDLPFQIGTFAYAELMELRERGFEIEILCLRSRLSEGPGAENLRRSFPVQRSGYLTGPALAATARTFLRRPGLFVRSIVSVIRDNASSPALLGKSLGLVPKCCLFAEALGDRGVDRLHSYWASLPGRAAWWISRFSGIPYQTWAHAGADIYNRRTQTPGTLAAVLHSASLVLTCNHANLEYFREILRAEAMAKVVLHSHGIDVAQFRPESGTGGSEEGTRGVGSPGAPGRARSEARPIAASPLRLLSVGRLSEAKGFHHAIRACAILRDAGLAVRYRIIGEGAYRPVLESLIDELGLSGSVELVGERDQSTLPPEYRAADVYLCPCVVGRRGSRDGLPNVLLEAMASGTACIGSDAVGIPEAIEDRVTGRLVPPEDAEALAAAVRELGGDGAQRARLGTAGRALVEQRFSRQTCMDRLAEILREHGTLAGARGGADRASPTEPRTGTAAPGADRVARRD